MVHKKIVFLMPREASWPSGGLKVVFDYANRLAKDGFAVKLVYPMFRIDETFDLLHRIIYWFVFLRIKLNNSFKPSSWFRLDKRIEQKFVWSLETYAYNKSDLHIATAVHTAYSLNQYCLPYQQKYYFIQDFENWMFSSDEVIASYHFRMYKIVISRWLQDLISEVLEKSTLVPNGFDTKLFQVISDIRNRDRYHIVSLYHNADRKDIPTAIKAFNIVRERGIDIKVSFFGVPPSPNLPEWYTYYRQPSKEKLVELYNDAAIYVGTSKVEGWGLTVGEAMLCGCAVACTNNKGYLEMAKDNDSALVSEVGDAEALAENIIRLVKDDNIRFRIAEAGNAFIQGFNIEASYEKFKAIVTQETV